jgi:hypothetical protein
MKQQKKELEKGKLNQGIQNFQINTQAGQEAMQSLKNKNRVPVEAEVYDAKQLEDMMKELMGDLKTLVED